ncbi:MAG: 30S ribosomal protein S12 methylthiotransferase RimO [Deltaproteobacteria bacterium]|nr:30S ribosomal protein S12 methylthiotransferase RimO [Deltaproteobacteria bacterium]
MADSKATLLRVYVVSLGCPKNMVDSERLMAAIKALGFRPTVDPKQADLLVINTCAFIRTATEEAIFNILRLAEIKKPGAKLAVMGCLVSRYGDEMSEALTEADLAVPPNGYPEFLDKLCAWYGLADKPRGDGPKKAKASPLGLDGEQRTVKASALPAALPSPSPSAGFLVIPAAFQGPFETWHRDQGTPFWRSWLKIAEGCDNRCSYCLIPSIRGPLKLRPMEDLVLEAEKLAQAGVKELTLVAQDLTAWSDGDKDLSDLVRQLSDISTLVWIRLMYAYPERLKLKLVEALASIPKLVPYLDVPVQHSSPKILKSMGRVAKNPLDLINKLRKWWPGVALRTTLMVGFPGETDEDYDTLARFVESAVFEHVGVFKFSPEEGAKASSFPNQVPPMVSERRRRNLMSRQRKISLALNKARVGQSKLVLVEGASPDTDLIMTGRADFQAPEVDGVVYFDGYQPQPGQMVMAKFLKATAYDLSAAVESESF